MDGGNGSLRACVCRRRRHAKRAAGLDLGANRLRLEPRETKDEDGRMLPLAPELRDVLLLLLEKTRQLEKTTERVIPWMFHRNGANPSETTTVHGMRLVVWLGYPIG
jgi:hypothetical protein